MVVWQPFFDCWRYIIARVSEMHVAYHKLKTDVGLSLHRNEQTESNETKSRRPAFHILPMFHSASRCEGRKCIVLGLCNVSLLSPLTQFLLLFIVPQYGRLAAIYRLLAFNHSACLRNARRISYKKKGCGLFTSAEQTTFNISNNFAIPLLPSFLPYLHHRMCVQRGENDDGYRVRLKIGVRSLLRRKVLWSNNSLLLSCVCSSVWSFGSHFRNWRLIIARVSEMHVAYHTRSQIVVYLHQRNKQKQTATKTKSRQPTRSHLTCMIVGGGAKRWEALRRR
jgi:hypothetical protein